MQDAVTSLFWNSAKPSSLRSAGKLEVILGLYRDNGKENRNY